MTRQSFTPLAVALVATIALLASPLSARASLTFDVRAREVTGPNLFKMDDHSILVGGTGGKVVFDVWAIIQGADANLTNDRLQLYSFRIKSSGTLVLGNMFADNTVNPDTGPVNGWQGGAGASSGTLQDLDNDGDLDIGAADAEFANFTSDNANGRNLAPTGYSGPGAAAEFLVYSFEMANESSRGGGTIVAIERSPVNTVFLWREDRANGFNKNGFNSTIAVGQGVTFFVPEPGTWLLMMVAFVGVVVIYLRNHSAPRKRLAGWRTCARQHMQ